MAKIQYVVDTSALFPTRSETFRYWEESDFNRGQKALAHFTRHVNEGPFYVPPQVLIELRSIQQTLDTRAEIIGKTPEIKKYLTELKGVARECHAAEYNWRNERGLNLERAKKIFAFTQVHNPYLDRTRLGGIMETDKHVITAAIMRGFHGAPHEQVGLVTRDTSLQESFRKTLAQAHQDNQLRKRVDLLYVIIELSQQRALPPHLQQIERDLFGG